MNRLPASQRYKRHSGRWKRYEKQRPGHYVQIDVKFIEPEHHRIRASEALLRIHRDRRLYPASAYAAPKPGQTRKTAVKFSTGDGATALQVEKIQTDNGAEFQSSFHWHVLDQGIGHIYISPGTPRLNGKVERSHRSTPRSYRLLKGSSRIMPACSTKNSRNGRTTTTTTDRTEGSEAKPRTNDCYKRPRLSLSPAIVSHTARWDLECAKCAATQLGDAIGTGDVGQNVAQLRRTREERRMTAIHFDHRCAHPVEGVATCPKD